MKILHSGSVIAVLGSSLQHFKSPGSDGVDYRSPIREILNVPDLQDGSELRELVLIRAETHSKLSGSVLHGPPDHQPVPGLEDVEGAGHVGVAHGADKDRNVVSPVLAGFYKIVHLLLLGFLALRILIGENPPDSLSHKLISSLRRVKRSKLGQLWFMLVYSQCLTGSQ